MKNKWFKALIIGVITLFLAGFIGLNTFTNTDAFGDVGGHSGTHGFSSGGGHSSSGGSSSSGSGSSGGVYYGGGSGSVEFNWPVFIIVFVIVGGVFVFSYVMNSKKKKNEQIYVPDTFDISKLMPMNSLKELYPDFDEEKLNEEMSNWYVRMQNAWTAKDFEPMRPYFSDALFGQLERQLNQLKQQGMTNYVMNIGVLNVDCEGWYQEDGQDFIAAKIQTRITDWTEIDKTGEVISGDKTHEKFMTYRWILSRTTGNNEQRVNTQNCPNCGGTVDVNKSAQCPYCGTMIESENHSWVINSIQGIEQINTD